MFARSRDDETHNVILPRSATALLPYSIDLTKPRSNNTLDIQVRNGEDFLGTLKMGCGSPQWWPSNNKTRALRKNWRQFAEMLTRSMA